MIKDLIILTGILPYAYALPELSLSWKHPPGIEGIASVKRGVLAQSGKRDVETNVFDVLSWSVAGAYYVNVTVGTPPQIQTLILSTGSSDTYFDASNASQCQKASDYTQSSCRGGTFDRSSSSSYREIAASPAFNTSYGDGSHAMGPWATDVIGIGDVSISGIQIGVADEFFSTTGPAIGILGLGYFNNEAISSLPYYPNLLESMFSIGAIKSRLYSIYLGSLSAYAGSIIFGGLDNSKYTGPLASLNVLPAVYNGNIDVNISQFIVPITAAEVTVNHSTTSLWSGGSANVTAYNRNDTALPVLLDTGSAAWSVPTSYYNAIRAHFTYVANDSTCPCQYANSGDTFELEFGGAINITFDASQFIVPYINETTLKPVTYSNGNEACFFAVSPDDSGSSSHILGFSFLRSMYTVFDLENRQVSVAQAAFGITADPNIVEVEAGPHGLYDAIPDIIKTVSNTWSLQPTPTGTVSNTLTGLATPVGTATGINAIPVAAQVTLQTASSNSQYPTGTAVGTINTAASLNTGSSSAGKYSGSSSNAGAIAGGVVGGIAGLALIAGTAWFLLKRRQRRLERGPMPRPGHESYETQQIQ